MTFTRLPLLAAATCLVALSGCDAVGPESASASIETQASTVTPGSVVASQPEFDGPLSAIQPSDTCRFFVDSDSPVVEWRASRNLEIVRSRTDMIAVRATGANGQRARVLGRTADGQTVQTVLRIQENADGC